MYTKIGHILNFVLVTLTVLFGLFYYLFDFVFVRKFIAVLEDPNNRTAILLVLTLIATSNLAILASMIVPSGPAMTIPVINEKGRIDIEIGAIEECLTRVLRSRDEVQDARVQVFLPPIPKNPIRVLGTVSIWDQPSTNTLDITEDLQSLLKQRFEEILAVESDVQFDVRLRKIPEPSRKPTMPPSEVEAPPAYRDMPKKF